MTDDVDPRRALFDAELQAAISRLKSDGKRLYVLCVEGEDAEGAPTHWFPADPENNDAALGPLVPMEDGVADTEGWERDNPGYVELLDLMEEVGERMDEAEAEESPA